MRQGPTAPDDLQVVHRLGVRARPLDLTDQRRQRLASVERAAAAPRDDRLNPGLARAADAVANQVDRGLARDGQRDHLDALGAERAHGGLGARGVSPGHHQDAPGAHGGDRGRQLARGSWAEHDASGGGQLEAQKPPSPGKTLTYFRLERGAAIISATASRQRW